MMKKTQKDKFQIFVSVSVTLHILVFLISRFDIFSSSHPPMEFKNAIRVDIIGLPDKIEPPAPTPVAQQEPEKVALPEKKIKKDLTKLKNLEKQQQDAMTKLKQKLAMDRLHKKIEDEKAKAQEEAKQKKEEEKKYVGNVLTEGSSLEGLNQIALTDYYQKVKEHVQQYWALPQWLSELNLKAQAKVLVDERGYVISRGMFASSGNKTFDDFVINTIDKASPLPPPPNRLSGALKSGGFILRFPD
ncbi:MAG: TonB C-terminal domain-containing protein [Bdellovibrionales bacterium]|nr:TonB C-terminal domain-containing protein [Bdellovibrionales bacterium]